MTNKDVLLYVFMIIGSMSLVGRKGEGYVEECFLKIVHVVPFYKTFVFFVTLVTYCPFNLYYKIIGMDNFSP